MRMIVICTKCNARYRVKTNEIKGESAWFNCRKCDNIITVEKPASIQKAVELETEESVDDMLLQSEAVTNDATDTDLGLAGDISSQPAISGKKRGLNLVSKVIISMLIASLIPAAVYFSFSYKQIKSHILEDLEEWEHDSVLLSKGVDEWLDDNIKVLSLLSEQADMKSMEREGQEEMLKTLNETYPWIYLAFTTNLQGQNIARSDGKPLKDYSDRQYVKDVVSGKDVAWQMLTGKTSKKPALVIAVPIKNGGKTVGLVAAAMARNAISDTILTFERGDTGTSFLVDEKGRIVAHPDDAFVMKAEEMNRHPLIRSAKSGAAIHVDFVDDDGEEIIGVSHKTKFGWILVTQQNKAEAFAPVEKARRSALILLSAMLIIIFVVALLASRAIVNPIKKVTHAANQISMGNLDVELERSSRDEIGDLAEAVMRMQDSLRFSLAKLTGKV